MSTNINCSLNCIHQVDGKCGLNNISSFSGSINDSCVFFEENAPKNVPKKTTQKNSDIKKAFF